MPDLLDELLQLERAGWRSLCDGTGGDFYGGVMTDDAHMVLAGGTVMTRAQVVDSLENAPPWASFDIDEPHLVDVADGVVALVYSGTGHRAEGPSFTAVMTSLYTRKSTGWQLVHYQQTPTT